MKQTNKKMHELDRIIAWIPHTGVYLPNVDNSPMFNTLRRDALLLADEKVDRLYPFLPNKIISGYSRFVVDLERYLDNSKEPMVQKGMGCLYNRLIDGTPFDRAVFGESAYYTQYYKHKHLQLKQAIENIGDGAVLLDLHSFNPLPLACDIDTRPERPDICLGFNDDSTKPNNITLHHLKNTFEESGFKVAFNAPFTGAMTADTPTKYKSLMIEINKKCYLGEHIQPQDIARLVHILRRTISFL